MAMAARDRLARTLRGDAQTAFSVELTARMDDLSLDVEGFGHVKLPVTPAKARKILGLGRPARFGRGEQTLTDPDVRDTWEIPKHRFLRRSPGQHRHHGSKIQPRSPRANAHAERFVLTARTEITDQVLIIGERHLRSVLGEYARHYNGRRPYRSRRLRPPRPDDPAADLTQQWIKRQAILGGLLSEYQRAA